MPFLRIPNFFITTNGVLVHVENHLMQKNVKS